MNIAASVENPPFENRKGWGSLWEISSQRVGQPANLIWVTQRVGQPASSKRVCFCRRSSAAGIGRSPAPVPSAIFAEQEIVQVRGPTALHRVLVLAGEVETFGCA